MAKQRYREGGGSYPVRMKVGGGGGENRGSDVKMEKVTLEGVLKDKPIIILKGVGNTAVFVLSLKHGIETVSVSGGWA